MNIVEEIWEDKSASVDIWKIWFYRKAFCYKLNILSINNIIEATIIKISPICIILFRTLNICSIKNTWITHIIGINVFEIEKYPNKSTINNKNRTMLYFLFKTFLPIFFWLPILIIYNYILTNYKSVCRIDFINQATNYLIFFLSLPICVTGSNDSQK